VQRLPVGVPGPELREVPVEEGAQAAEQLRERTSRVVTLSCLPRRPPQANLVSGTAEVTNGTAVTVLTENQSTYIPLGQTHRLANPGKMPLDIIEVQSGSYLGDDDIVRFEDNYGRL